MAHSSGPAKSNTPVAVDNVKAQLGKAACHLNPDVASRGILRKLDEETKATEEKQKAILQQYMLEKKALKLENEALRHENEDLKQELVAKHMYCEALEKSDMSADEAMAKESDWQKSYNASQAKESDWQKSYNALHVQHVEMQERYDQCFKDLNSSMAMCREIDSMKDKSLCRLKEEHENLMSLHEALQNDHDTLKLAYKVMSASNVTGEADGIILQEARMIKGALDSRDEKALHGRALKAPMRFKEKGSLKEMIDGLERELRQDSMPSQDNRTLQQLITELEQGHTSSKLLAGMRYGPSYCMDSPGSTSFNGSTVSLRSSCVSPSVSSPGR
jgi:hypothetical protein